MEHFTPLSAAIGGLLIGTSALMLWLGLGRVAGIDWPTAGLFLLGGVAGGIAGMRAAIGLSRMMPGTIKKPPPMPKNVTVRSLMALEIL